MTIYNDYSLGPQINTHLTFPRSQTFLSLTRLYQIISTFVSANKYIIMKVYFMVNLMIHISIFLYIFGQN